MSNSSLTFKYSDSLFHELATIRSELTPLAVDASTAIQQPSMLRPGKQWKWWVLVSCFIMQKWMASAIKMVAMLLTIWGFALYTHHQYLDDNKPKENEAGPIPDSQLDGIVDKLV
ncbi:hypothetical protein PTKIN_Ptkin18bG0036400 [Pterospermum kingtungense]